MLTTKRTSSSFGPDGRRKSNVGPAPRLKCVGRAGSGFSSCTRPSTPFTAANGHSSSKLFQPGAKVLIARAPVMAGLSVSSGLHRKFQRPMTKRRSYDKNAELALKTSSLGPKRRMDGMAKLMARAGKGLSYQLPGGNRGENGEDADGSSGSESEEEAEEERPFEPLMVWKSPHDGGEAKGLPPKLMTVTRPDDYGIEETVTELLPAPASAYANESAFVPPVLAKWLRPHQREGVKFMYECVMGLKDFNGNGCILADDMGLGKTLQSVTLIWTLLRTGITANKQPTAKRVIVICPCSLVKNWDNEFVKWLGPGTVKTLALAESDRKTVEKNIDCFVKTKMFNVLIASYETIRTHVGRLNKYKDCCDLMVCDEAHRLKNRENQTSMALNSIPVKRRVLLTGTPMQNDLEEFYAMVDFTNPGILGTQEEFRRKTLYPILRGREPDATEKQKAKMMELQNEMSSIVNDFILRRVNTLNAQHLPPKLVQVVCCNLTEIQQNMYLHLCNSKDMQHVLDGKQVNCLGSIQMLMKLCNHPSLVVNEDSSKLDRGSGRRAASKTVSYAEEEKSAAAPGADGIAKFMPYEAMGGGRNAPVMPELSGKMFVLYRLMREMRKPGNGNDKIVIVSNYTQTLDLIGRMCRENNWGFCRLDGSISMKKRQKMCDEFNDPTSSLVAFLLSSKAGGCGLNLIGGNRLVLFDPDWNPAVDKQAAARCWRDGQKKRCFTYRFLATGTVEEKIFQRQLSKEGLQSVVDDKEQVNALSTKDLRNLFKLRQGTPSDTHDKLKCERCKIIADDAEAREKRVLPKKLVACRELLEEIMKIEDASKFLKPLNPVEDGVSVEQYQKLVKQPIDFGTILRKLNVTEEKNQYPSVAAFSKDVNRVFSNVLKVWEPGHELADTAGRLQLWWVQKWTELVPRLMSMKPDSDQEKENCDPQCSDDFGNIETGAASYLNERGEDYQEQIGMPDEENMRLWSHHYNTDTVDDPIFRAAMRGYDSVSFIFGLEVTWGLIQQRQQEEEERQAMLELEKMNELVEVAEDIEKTEDDSTNEDVTCTDLIGAKKSTENNEGADGDLIDENNSEGDDDQSTTACNEESTHDCPTKENLDLLSKIIVGKTRLSVLWPDDDIYYPCIVHSRCPNSSSKYVYNLRYDDGEVETLDLTSEIFRIEDGDEMAIDAPDSDNTTSESSLMDDEKSGGAEEQSLEHSQRSSPTSNTWDCPSCTFQNKMKVKKCTMCGTKIVSSKRQKLEG